MKDSNIIIFSKNRASQLELLIRSMKIFFKEFKESEIKILYKFTSDEYEKGYEKLKIIHNDNNIFYFNQNGNDFQTSFLSIFDNKKKLSVFFVDDNVFKEKFSIEDNEFNRFINNPDILTLSLRLHPNLNYCYPAQIKQSCPNISNGEFNWINQQGDYGYPMSLDGHIFRTEQILHYLYKNQYNCPNLLEAQMASNPLKIPKMLCYNKSKIMNIPLNKVQDFNNNVHGNITSKFLNDNFLNNKIISLFNIIGFDNFSCHQEIDIKFDAIE